MFNSKFNRTALILGLGFLFTLPFAPESFSKSKVKLPFSVGVKIDKSDLTPKTKSNLVVDFKIDSGNYLYKDSISFRVNPINGVKIGKLVLPKAEKKLDKFSNTQKEIYHDSFSVSLPVEVNDKVNSGKISFSSVIGYQGCSSNICYIPQEKNIIISANVKKK